MIDSNNNLKSFLKQDIYEGLKDELSGGHLKEFGASLIVYGLVLSYLVWMTIKCITTKSFKIGELVEDVETGKFYIVLRERDFDFDTLKSTYIVFDQLKMKEEKLSPSKLRKV